MPKKRRLYHFTYLKCIDAFESVPVNILVPAYSKPQAIAYFKKHYGDYIKCSLWRENVKTI